MCVFVEVLIVGGLGIFSWRAVYATRAHFFCDAASLFGKAESNKDREPKGRITGITGWIATVTF
jgi:hypothetical protein